MGEREDVDVTVLLEHEKALQREMDEHRAAIAELAERRRQVVAQIVQAIGAEQTRVALNISRQALHKLTRPQ